jgi:hypothetical protein
LDGSCGADAAFDAHLPYLTRFSPFLHLFQCFSFSHESFAPEFFHLFLTASCAGAKIDRLFIATRGANKSKSYVGIRYCFSRDTGFEGCEGTVAEEDYSDRVGLGECREGRGIGLVGRCIVATFEMVGSC